MRSMLECGVDLTASKGESSNGSPLLTTKLYIPQARPELVPRQRLTTRLDEGVGRKLTLVSAPAGFGKTTVLSEWAARCQRPVAWVSLDKDDNDPARFWAYVIAALRTVYPQIGEEALAALQAPGSPSIQPPLASLINALARVATPSILVLDDLHAITSARVHDTLTYVLDHLPPLVHLVLASRADPPWPLARWRARGELTEMRVDELRFTSSEVEAFLVNAMKLNLSPEEVLQLEERTEGWIVGLHMAALSMQGQRDLSGFVSAFTGTHRFILDYLVEEVLEAQPGHIQDFLLETSILERMTARLCDAVTGGSDSQELLSELERTNLFVVPLDDERRWYRYHHLFASLLRSRLERAGPDQLLLLHQRAGAWCEQHGLIAEAVAHALETRDIQRVARLVAGNALSLVYHGELRTLERQLATLPHEHAPSRPWLSVAHAWTLAYAGQLERVGPVLEEAEKLLADPDAKVDEASAFATEVRSIDGHMAAIRAYTAAMGGEMSEAAALARAALDHLPPGDLMMRGYASTLLGTVLRSSGDLAGAAEACQEAITISRTSGDSALSAVALCDMAALDFARGRLHDAVAVCSQVREIADAYEHQVGQPLPVLGYAYMRWSAVLREWNQLEPALFRAREGLKLCLPWGQADVLVYAYSELAEALRASGDTEGAMDAIQHGSRIADAVAAWPGLRVAAARARLWLAVGKVEAAARWERESGERGRDGVRFQHLAQSLVAARVRIARGAPERALRLLAPLLSEVEAAGANGYALQVLVLVSVAHHALRETDAALAALERALGLGQPEGYVRTFLEEGAAMADLLRMAIARGIAVDYAGALLAELEREVGGKQESRGPASLALVEPLSERETEVLRFLTTHLSSREIAQELCISVHTVRTHIKNIYGKLNVHGRSDALKRARELDLL